MECECTTAGYHTQDVEFVAYSSPNIHRRAAWNDLHSLNASSAALQFSEPTVRSQRITGARDRLNREATREL